MDTQEFKKRFMPYHRMLYRVAYRLTGNVQDAEDLLQDTYMRLWQKREQIVEETLTEAYLIIIMKNLYRDKMRLKSIDTSADLTERIEPPDDKPLPLGPRITVTFFSGKRRLMPSSSCPCPG